MSYPLSLVLENAALRVESLKGGNMVSIQERANAFLDLVDRPIPKVLLGCWGVLAAWDTFVSQFIPEETAKHFPKAYQVLAMTYGWLSIQTWFLIGASIVVVISLEYAARHKWRHQLATGVSAPVRDSTRPLLAIFWLSVVSAIGGIWLLDAAHWDLRISKIPPPPVQPAPQPLPPAKSDHAAPTKPWVSREEFENAKATGRLLLPFTPGELSSMNFMRGSVGTNAYVGNWVKISAPLLTVEKFAEKDKKEYLMVRVSENQWAPVLVFDAKKWGERVLVLKTTATVTAICQLSPYDKPAFDMTTAPKFIGLNCELN